MSDDPVAKFKALKAQLNTEGVTPELWERALAATRKVEPFAAACARHPFANGTEGDAWMSAWCNHCARDHGMHHGKAEEPMCPLIAQTMLGPDSTWPEGWLPEPDDGDFYLPSRIVCLAYTPCETCGGDPGPDERAERVEFVTNYWKNR